MSITVKPAEDLVYFYEMNRLTMNYDAVDDFIWHNREDQSWASPFLDPVTHDESGVRQPFKYDAEVMRQGYSLSRIVGKHGHKHLRCWIYFWTQIAQTPASYHYINIFRNASNQLLQVVACNQVADQFALAEKTASAIDLNQYK